MKQFAKLSLVPFLLLAIDDANAAKSDTGEKIDLTAIEARISDAENAVAGNDADIANLQADVAALQSQVDSLALDIAALGVNSVNADCVADVGALQAAVNAAPSAGAIINVSGVCDAVDIIGKSNILIDGGDVTSANGVSGDLVVSASNNVQISGFTSASALITHNSSVFFNDVNVDGFVNVAANSTLTQTGGELEFGGQLLAETGGQVLLYNGSIGSVSLTRNASVVLFPQLVDGYTIDVLNGVGVFSGSNFLGQSAAENSNSALNITSPNNIFVQRNASMLLVGSTVVVNAPAFFVRQNAVLDIINVAEENFYYQPDPEDPFITVPTISLKQGGGARALIGPSPDSALPLIAICDDSAWANFDFVCGP